MTAAETREAAISTELAQPDPEPVEELTELADLLANLEEAPPTTSETATRPVDRDLAGEARPPPSDPAGADPEDQTLLEGSLAGPDEASVRREVERALEEERDRHRWVRNINGCVHLARSYSTRMDVPPEDWRTVCGWAFGTAPGATRSDTPPGAAEHVCGRGCFSVAESLGLYSRPREALRSEGEED